MSNCHSQFLAFDAFISLNKFERNKLETSKRAVISKITKAFQDKGYKAPQFIGQGSYTMDTSIRPVSGYYDLDLGVYIKNLIGDPDDWPKTESIHQVIFNAVDGHTSIRPISKKSCIRVVYKSPYTDKNDISYHIDLPVYAYKVGFWNNDPKTVIGFKGEKQWSEFSSPSDFTKWFLNQCKRNSKDENQLKRIVKYLKAWKENCPKSPVLPNGMTLTVLASKNFKPHQRDDVAFLETVKEFNYKLGWHFSIEKPTNPFNDLSEHMTNNEESNFMDRTERLIQIGEEALNITSQTNSIKKWARIFGSRFIEDLNYGKLII